MISLFHLNLLSNINTILFDILSIKRPHPIPLAWLLLMLDHNQPYYHSDIKCN